MATPFEMDKFRAELESAAAGSNSLLVCVVARKDGKDGPDYAIVFGAHGLLCKKDFVMAGREIMEHCEKASTSGARGVLQ